MGFADEMRLGLHSQIRRVWFPRGVKLRQKQQMRFVWRWLYLCVDAVGGKLTWCWCENMKQDSMEASLGVFAEAGVDTIVWDNAPSHRAKVLRDPAKNLPTLCFLPPYSPELNPAERVFEEVRRQVEGRIWDSIEDKEAAVETYLTALSADVERVKRLAGWQWIQQAVEVLPASPSTQVA